MQGLILAGGFGTRLKSILGPNTPKPMANINGKPFLAILIEFLKIHGITEIILSTHFKHEVILDYFEYKYFNIPIRYIHEDKPLGTGGAILFAIKSLNLKNPLFIVNGDTFIKYNYANVWNELKNVDGIIATRMVSDVSRYGEIKTDPSNRIIKITEKGFIKSGLINCGVYLIKPEQIIETCNELQLQDMFSFEEALLPTLLKEYKYGAHICDDYFIDIGIAEDYLKFCNDHKNNIII